MSVHPITRQELQSALESARPPIVVEALGAMDYDDAHLPGAVNLPHDQVDELAAQVLPDTDAPVVVYCSNTACQNSVIASRRLVELGYTDVREYVEGKEDWVSAGLPVEQSATAER